MPGMQRLLGESKRDRVMDAWSRVAGRIEQATDVLGTVTFYCTLAMVAAGTYNAIMRYLSRWAHIDPESTEGLDPVLYWIGEAARRLSSNTFIELQWYLFSLVFLLGAAYTLRCNAHVRVDVFYNRLTLEKKAWINILGSLAFSDAVLCAYDLDFVAGCDRLLGAIGGFARSGRPAPLSTADRNSTGVSDANAAGCGVHHPGIRSLVRHCRTSKDRTPMASGKRRICPRVTDGL